MARNVKQSSSVDWKSSSVDNLGTSVDLMGSPVDDKRYLLRHSLKSALDNVKTEASSYIYKTQDLKFFEEPLTSDEKMKSDEVISLQRKGYNCDEHKFVGAGRHSRVFLAVATEEAIKNNSKFSLIHQKLIELLVAVKIIDLDKGYFVMKQLALMIPNEVENMNKVFREDFVIKLFDAFISNKKIFLIMEQGDYDVRQILSDNRLFTDNKNIRLDAAKNLFFECVRCILILHSHKIAHRDIQPGNFVIGSNKDVKICDFGFSVDTLKIELRNGRKLVKDTCGTAPFMAPEVVNQPLEGYDPMKADIFSLGSLFFYFLTGSLLFPVDDLEALQRCFERFNVDEFPFEIFIDKNAVNLIKSMLNFDPNARPTIEEVFKHPLFIYESLYYYPDDHEWRNFGKPNDVTFQPNNHYQEVAIRSYLISRKYILEELNKVSEKLTTQEKKLLCVRVPLPLESVKINKDVFEIWGLMSDNYTKHWSNIIGNFEDLFKSKKISVMKEKHEKFDIFTIMDSTRHQLIIINDLPIFALFKRIVMKEKDANSDFEKLFANLPTVKSYPKKYRRLPFIWRTQNPLYLENNFPVAMFSVGFDFLIRRRSIEISRELKPVLSEIVDYNLARCDLKRQTSNVSFLSSYETGERMTPKGCYHLNIQGEIRVFRRLRSKFLSASTSHISDFGVDPVFSNPPLDHQDHVSEVSQIYSDIEEYRKKRVQSEEIIKFSMIDQLKNCCLKFFQLFGDHFSDTNLLVKTRDEQSNCHASLVTLNMQQNCLKIERLVQECDKKIAKRKMKQVIKAPGKICLKI